MPLCAERWPSHFHFLWIQECMVCLSSWLVRTLKVIFPSDYSKNLEAERSAPISCHFLFDNWKQSKNQKEIIVCDQRQRNQTTHKTTYSFTFMRTAKNKYLGLIKGIDICCILNQYKSWRKTVFLKRNIIKTYCQGKNCDYPSTQYRKERVSPSSFLIVSPMWATLELMSSNKTEILQFHNMYLWEKNLQKVLK